MARKYPFHWLRNGRKLLFMIIINDYFIVIKLICIMSKIQTSSSMNYAADMHIATGFTRKMQTNCWLIISFAKQWEIGKKSSSSSSSHLKKVGSSSESESETIFMIELVSKWALLWVEWANWQAVAIWIIISNVQQQQQTNSNWAISIIAKQATSRLKVLQILTAIAWLHRQTS